MKYSVCFLLLSTCALAAAPSPAVPLQNEALNYSIVWPSGLSLGEAHWKAQNTGTVTSPMWAFDFEVDARIPGFALIDILHSNTNAGYCTEHFTRQLEHGRRKSGEMIDVDAKRRIATRKPTRNGTTKGGGESDVSVPDCVHDPLAYLFMARQELLSGRIPPAQSVIYGALYEVKLTNLGRTTVPSGDRKVETDRVGCEIQGPSSHWNVEIFFARDAARTPVLIKVPMTLGTFSLELER